ncbi:MAG: diacylglyceryl transferase [Bacteroidetes bacterium]|nr:diacylglyceryl transferase [Bacteroidota bacterium]
MNNVPKWVSRLMLKWNLKSPFHVLIICVVFAITGSASVKLAAPVMEYIGFHKHDFNPWLYWPLRIILIFPVYQVVLIIVGTLFGQFRFFWNIEKKMMSRLISPFQKSN